MVTIEKAGTALLCCRFHAIVKPSNFSQKKFFSLFLFFRRFFVGPIIE
ncbi:hypothetical protein [uncultured Acidaminococcus sp.]|jgi:hypothetical protein|nr:hypothetical protein [uncultured Acidaminococcus sp.]